MSKKSSQTGVDAPASVPVTDEPGKENAPATTETPLKPKAERRYRGKMCEIVRTTVNRATGAVYDLIMSPRQVTNRRDNSVSTVFLGLKLRRPGTGTKAPGKEDEIEPGGEV